MKSVESLFSIMSVRDLIEHAGALRERDCEILRYSSASTILTIDRLEAVRIAESMIGRRQQELKDVIRILRNVAEHGSPQLNPAGYLGLADWVGSMTPAWRCVFSWGGGPGDAWFCALSEESQRIALHLIAEIESR